MSKGLSSTPSKYPNSNSGIALTRYCQEIVNVPGHVSTADAEKHARGSQSGLRRVDTLKDEEDEEEEEEDEEEEDEEEEEEVEDEAPPFFPTAAAAAAEAAARLAAARNTEGSPARAAGVHVNLSSGEHTSATMIRRAPVETEPLML